MTKSKKFPEIVDRLVGDVTPNKPVHAKAAGRGIRKSRAGAAGIKVELPTPASWITLANSLPNAPKDDISESEEPAAKYNIKDKCAYMSPKEFCDLAESRNLGDVRHYGADRILIDGGALIQAEFVFLKPGDDAMRCPTARSQDLRKYGVSGTLGKYDQVLFQEHSRREISQTVRSYHSRGQSYNYRWGREFESYTIDVGFIRKISMACDLSAHVRNDAGRRIIKAGNEPPKSTLRTSLDVLHFIRDIAVVRGAESPLLTGETLTCNPAFKGEATAFKGRGVPLCQAFSVSAYDGLEPSSVEDVTYAEFSQRIKRALSINNGDFSGMPVIRSIFSKASTVRLKPDETSRARYLLTELTLDEANKVRLTLA